MLKNTLFLLFFAGSQLLNAQTITGVWKTVDDETKETKSLVEIYQSGESHYGKINKLFNQPADKTCDKCPGDRKNKPLVGMVVLENMKLEGGMLQNGKILDPEKGKTYTCKMWLKEGNPDVLVVRGYILGFYRTQEWHRQKG